MTDDSYVQDATPRSQVGSVPPICGGAKQGFQGHSLDQVQETEMTTVQLRQERIIQDICRMLEPHNKTGIPIGRDTDITKDLDVDSLAVMDFIMSLEDQFDISISLNAMAEIRTVEDLSAAVLMTKRDH